MFGSHLSIAGGHENALIEARELGMETVQLFTKNQQQWAAKPLSPEQIATFREHALRLNYPTIVAHDSYLINLAAADEAQWHKSKATFSEEMRRCDQLGVKYLVTHPGAHVGTGDEAGLERIARAYNDIIREHPGDGVVVCIETTAGQGTCLGWRFEQLARLLGAMQRPERFGVCVDTCHLLAAGYDITTAAGTLSVLAEFERIVGLKHLKVFHLNDSKKPLAARVDRHEHIGRGFVGLAAFGVICRDPRFAAIPKILETSKEGFAEDGREWDVVNLELLRQLAKGQKVRVPPKAAAEQSTKVTKGTKTTKTATAKRGKKK